MRCLIVGLGTQGKKRRAVAGNDVVATVDPHTPADYTDVRQVPTKAYDSALVCTPDAIKLGILDHLLGHGKHVLVEKPLLAEVPERLRMLAATARRTGAACYTAYNHRFEPHLARLKQVLDGGELGTVYRVRMFYGNGTARDVRDSQWRDRGLGVLADLGSHLLDLALFLMHRPAAPFIPWELHRLENRAFDHVSIGCAGPPALALEASLLSWRNTFTLDLIAERGSAHVHGLCKWGPSTLTLRRRALPSGKPTEETATLECPDPTWAAEYEHFRRLCQTGGCNLENDLWINAVLAGLARDAGGRLAA
jgi:predicted dehydrogenase